MGAGLQRAFAATRATRLAAGQRVKHHSRSPSGGDVPKQRKEPDQGRYSGRLAKRLRFLREQSGILPAKLADKLTKAGYKVSVPTLYAWENGNLQVQLDALPYLAKAFGVTVSDLMPEK